MTKCKDTYRDGLILDEAQIVPEIFSYIKTAVDAYPRPGKFIVTSSQQFGLLAGVSESLAGRAAFITLLPFSSGELEAAGKLMPNPFEAIVKGFYTPLFDREISPNDWYTNYITSYVERDVRSILNIKDLGQFQIFVRMCASRVGQLLNLSSLALDCGLSHNTARSWLSVLEAWIRYSDSRREDCSLIYAGDQSFQWKGLAIIPWTRIDGANIT